MPLLPSSSEFALILANIERRLDGLERGNRLAHSSLENTTLPVYDDQGQVRQNIGRQPDGSYTVVDLNAPPPQATSAPILVPALGGLVVMWDGKSHDDSAWPLDFHHVEVHMSDAPFFTPTDETHVGVNLFSTKGGQVLVPNLNANDVYWTTLVAVNTSLIESAPSGYVSGSPDPALTDANLDALAAAVVAAQQAADSAITTYYSPSPPWPSGTSKPASFLGDLWFEESTSRPYRWDGSNWVALQDSELAEALALAATAQATADGKIRMFAQSNEPTGMTADDEGDLWFDTDDDNKPYRWDAEELAWLPMQLGSSALAPGAITADLLAAEIALLSRLIITSDSDAALEIANSDGTRTLLAADNSRFSGQATLEALDVYGNMRVRGFTNTVDGLLTLSSGVGDPGQQPVVTTDHPRVTRTTTGSNRRGLCEDPTNTYWVNTDTSVGGSTAHVQLWNKTTGVLVSSFPVNAGATVWYPAGGVTRIGSVYYVLAAKVVNGVLEKDNWRVFRYDATAGSGLGTLLGGGTGWPTNIVTGGTAWPTIGTDGTNILIHWKTASNNSYVREFAPLGTQLAHVPLGVSGVLAATSVNKTATGFSATRYVVTTNGGIYVFSTSGVAQTSEGWPPATGTIQGMCLGSDGFWHTLNGGNAVADYTWNVGTWDFAYSWVDNNPADDAETRPSPIFTATPQKYSRWRVSLPTAPPDDGTVDAAKIAYVYASPTGTALVRQAALAVGELSRAFTTLATTGTAAKTVNGFDARLSTSRGRVESAALAGDGLPVIALNGDGTGRVGPYGWDAAGATVTGLLRAPGQPFGRLDGTNSQVIASGANTSLDFNVTTEETGVTADLSGNRLVILTAGVHVLQAAGTWPSAAVGYRELRLMVNGAIVSYVKFSPNAATPTLVTHVGRLSVGDVVTAQTFQNSGSGLDLSGRYLTAALLH